MEKFNLKESFIKKNKTFIIAEIGSNHNQDLDFAFKTIDAAIDCGANAVKFQSLNQKELYFDSSKELKHLHKKIDLEENWHYELNDYCKKKGIIFFSAPTYLNVIDILEELNISIYKIASAQVGTFPQLVDKVASLKKDVFLSTGIVNIQELYEVVNIFKRNNNPNYYILHCNSIYPTPYEKINLKMIEKYKILFGDRIGFSDHSIGIYASIAAVALGARIIERHFVLDKKIDVPDAPISSDCIEFKELVKGIRAIEKSLKYRERDKIEKEEKDFKESIHYRLIINKKKSKEESFSKKDFMFKRSCRGIDCSKMDFIINNMILKKDIEQNTLLEWNMLEGK